MSTEQLWQAVLAQIQLNISSANFATWFANTKILKNESGQITVSVPNSFSKEWLEQKYNKDILKILRGIDESIKEVSYKVVSINKVSSPKKEYYSPDEQLGFSELEQDKETNLNQKYEFETLIVGPFNEMAVAAGQAISETPGEIYNPFFVYGGVGVGKTHLIQAIGNKIWKNTPDKRIKYIPAEKLISTVVNAIRNNSIEELKEDLRKIDVLIIDDIQFISGKEKTQEEFFHTFNSLHQANKQIILSSDKHPSSIPALTDRLRSRFEGGMMADIGLPDYETRLAILKQKSEEKGTNIPADVLEYMATNIQKNVRELESALNRIFVFIKMNNKIPDVEQTKKLLKDIITSHTKITTIKKIINVVTEFYDLPGTEVFYSSRKKEFARPRQLAMYLLKKELKLSYSVIGRKMGGKDHTTVMHAYQLIEREAQENEKFGREIDMILQRIYSA